MDYQPRTESLIFDGLDGFAGFRRDKTYELHYTYLEGDKVSFALPHAPASEPLVMDRVRFDEWFLQPKK